MRETMGVLFGTGRPVIAGWVALLLVAEAVSPLRKRTRPVAGRWAVNAVMTALVLATGTLVVRAAALAAVAWAGGNRFGISYWLPETGWARPVAGFLLMDLTFYWWHRANHELPLLWRFHNVHHVDPDLDVSTSFRFHLAEVLYSAVFRVAQAAVIGIAPVTFAAYELVFTCGTAFHHSNTRLPVAFERVLNRVFVTPRMHGIHHSGYREETGSNYSVVFSWWDLLHGTLRLNVPHARVETGVPGYLAAEDNSLPGLLAAPFIRQKDYWLHPDGTRRETRERAPAGTKRTTMME